MRTAPATSSECAAGSSAAIDPPIELPTRRTGPPVTSRMKRWSNWVFASTVVRRPPPRVRPNPARSGANTRQGPARRKAESGEAEREHATGPREFGSDRQPVGVGAAEPVHADDQRAVVRPAEVDVVDRAVEVGPAGGR